MPGAEEGQAEIPEKERVLSEQDASKTPEEPLWFTSMADQPKEEKKREKLIIVTGVAFLSFFKKM